METLKNRRLMVLFIIIILFIGIFSYNSLISKIGYTNTSLYLNNLEYTVVDKSHYIYGSQINSLLSAHTQWHTYDRNSPLPKSEDTGAVILRAKLPEGAWKNPAVFFRGLLADRAEIYIDNKLIYQLSSDKRLLKDDFIEGFAVPLPADFANKYLYCKLTAAGNLHLDKYENILIGSQRDIISKLVKKDLGKIVFGHFFIIVFLGLVITAVFLKSFEKRLLYSLIAFTFLIGIMTIGRCVNTLDMIYFYSPLFWYAVCEMSIFLVPIPFVFFFENILNSKNRLIYKIIYILHAIFAVGFLPIDIFYYYNNSIDSALYNLLILAFSVLGLFDFLLISFLSVKAALKGNVEAKIYLSGLSICILTLIYEIIYHRGALHWGFFAFILCQLLILARRYYLRLEQYSRELQDKNEELSALNKNLEQLVAARTASINNLLNNAGQGFLAFGRELTVFQEYSSQCLDIFKEKIENKCIADLIAQGDQEQKKFLENIFSCILNEKDQSRKKLYLGLLPAEKLINGKHIKLEYKLTRDTVDNPDENIMLILTDITEEKYFEHKAESERNTLKMVIKVVLNLNDFTECLKEYRNFCRYGVNDILRTSPTVKNVISEIYKNVHTFKGNFSIFEMMHSVNNLHNAEEEIVTLSRNSSQLHIDDIERVLSGLKLDTLLDEDMGILYEVLGERFIVQDNTIPVEKQRLLEIERHMSELLNEEQCAELLPVIRKLRYKPISELLKTYPDYSIRLSDRLQKPIYPFTIEGGDIQVDTDRYSDFSRSLVHIFRNALDHGIEPMEQRVQCGKNEYGNIKCTIELVNGEIVIRISDDGRGIDIERVRYKALEKGIYTAESIAKASKQELLDLIFIDEFSTKEIVNELSGRGVGLSAAKSEIEKLNGRIELHTVENKGTEFRFYIPYYEEADFR